MKVSHNLKRLLTSKTRQKLIITLFYTPSELYFVRQLVRISGEEINSVRRELDNLSQASLISSENRGNRLFYWANPDHFLYHDLVVLANKHGGLGAKIQENHQKIGKLKAVFYSQDFLHHIAEDKGNVDMLIVGEISLRHLQEYVKSEESSLGREINYMVMDRSELKLRLSKRDPIMVDFFLSYPALIIGNPDNIFK